MKLPESIPINWKTVFTGMLMLFLTGFVGDFFSPWTIKAQVEKNAQKVEKHDKELEQLKIQTKILTYGFCEGLEKDHPMKSDCKKILTKD